MKLLPYINAIYSLFSYSVFFVFHRRSCNAMPIAVSIELTNYCNLKCPCCATGVGLLERPKGFIDINLVRKIVSELKNFTLSAYLYFQGESMLHPRFFPIIEEMRELHGIISTNGHFLTEENCRLIVASGLKKVIVSYDGVSQETYSVYRKGGNINTVTEGIKCLTRESANSRSAPELELLFLYGKHNEHELQAVRAFAKSMGARFIIKSMQVNQQEDIEKWIPEKVRLSRYIPEVDGYRLKNSPKRGCMRMLTTAVITWDGKVIPCCYDKDAEFSFGNINEMPFKEIWHGEARRIFIRGVMSGRSTYKICSDCPQGLKLFFKL